nr:MAG TPA: hypothetical protein [Caudoviricetes sp.]
MFGILIGLFGGLVPLMVVFLIYVLVEDYEKLFIGISCVALILTVMGSLYIRVEMSRQWAVGYRAQKATIESSLQSDLLSGYERVALVQQATECNQELAERQYKASQWYGFDECKDVLDLKPIDIG